MTDGRPGPQWNFPRAARTSTGLVYRALLVLPTGSPDTIGDTLQSPRDLRLQVPLSIISGTPRTARDNGRFTDPQKAAYPRNPEMPS